MGGVAELAAELPRSRIDLYSDAVLIDPKPAYRKLRDFGARRLLVHQAGHHKMSPVDTD